MWDDENDTAIKRVTVDMETDKASAADMFMVTEQTVCIRLASMDTGRQPHLVSSFHSAHTTHPACTMLPDAEGVFWWGRSWSAVLAAYEPCCIRYKLDRW